MLQLYTVCPVKQEISTKPEIKKSTVLLLEKNRAIATSNMYRKFREVWNMVLEICNTTGRQTYRYTNHSTLPGCRPRGDAVTLD